MLPLFIRFLLNRFQTSWSRLFSPILRWRWRCITKNLDFAGGSCPKGVLQVMTNKDAWRKVEATVCRTKSYSIWLSGKSRLPAPWLRIRLFYSGKKQKITNTWWMSKQHQGTNRVFQTPSGEVWRFLPRQHQQLRTATCSKVRKFGQETQTCSVPSKAAEKVWSDGHEDLDWPVSRRTLIWRFTIPWSMLCTRTRSTRGQRW